MLYKFAKKEGIISILKYNTLKFSLTSEFNDPFEFHSSLIDKKISFKYLSDLFIRKNYVLTTRERINVSKFLKRDQKYYQNELNRKLEEQKKITRVCCFSLKRDNILMWGHYAECHKSACLVFNKELLLESFKSKTLIGEVKYEDEIHSVSFSDDSNKAIENWALTKNIDWKYESEFRIIHSLESLQFQLFNPAALTGVIFGACASEDFKAQIESMLFEDLKLVSVKTSEMKISESEFKLEEVYRN